MRGQNDEEDNKFGKRNRQSSQFSVTMMIIGSVILWCYLIISLVYKSNFFFDQNSSNNNIDTATQSHANNKKAVQPTNSQTARQVISHSFQSLSKTVSALDDRLAVVETIINQILDNNKNNPPAHSEDQTFPNQIFPLLECRGSQVDLGDGIVGLQHAFRDTSLSGGHSTPKRKIAALRDNPEIQIVTHGDVDLISRTLLNDQTWEPAMVSMVIGLSKHFRSRSIQMTLIDVGSNLGLLGFIAAKDGHISIFIEPVIQTVNLLCESVALNNIGAYTLVVPHALFATSRPALYMPIDEHNYGASAVTNHKPTPPVPFIEVKTTTLDNIAAQLGLLSRSHTHSDNDDDDDDDSNNQNGLINDSNHPIVVKINVGGLDYYVWEGAKKTLSDARVVAVFFVNSWMYEPSTDQRIEWLRDIEANMGYKLYCCTRCQDVSKPGGRCVRVDTSNRDQLLTSPAAHEMVAVRSDEILNIITNAPSM